MTDGVFTNLTVTGALIVSGTGTHTVAGQVAVDTIGEHTQGNGVRIQDPIYADKIREFTQGYGVHVTAGQLRVNAIGEHTQGNDVRMQNQVRVDNLRERTTGNGVRVPMGSLDLRGATPLIGAQSPREDHTTDYQVLPTDIGKLFLSKLGVGTLTFTLPVGADAEGGDFTFARAPIGNGWCVVKPGTNGVINVGGLGVVTSTGVVHSNDVNYPTIRVRYAGQDLSSRDLWIAVSMVGGWSLA